MSQLKELTIIQSLLYYKDPNLLINLQPSYFSIPILKIICFTLQEYIKLYNKFPNKTEFLIFLDNLIQQNKIDLPFDETQQQIELQKIQKIAEFFEPSQELTSQILNITQLKEEINKLITKNILRQNLDKIKDILITGEKAELLLQNLQQQISKQSLLIEDSKTIDWFLNLEQEIRKKVKSTGYLFLDKNMDGGLGAGEITLIASPPGIGKTTFLVNIAHNILSLYHDDTIILFITLELTEDQIFARLLATYFQIPLSEFKLKSPKQIINEQLQEKLIDKEEFLQFFSNIHVKYFPPGTDIRQIYQFINRFKEKYQTKDLVILIDYLNEIDYPKTKEIWLKMEYISTILDDLAIKTESHLWIACQAHSKNKKIKLKELEANIQYSKFLFDIKDLYGSKIGLSKKLTFGLGMTYNKELNKIFLSFFKNRILGKINEIAILNFDKNKYKLTMTEIEISPNLQDEFLNSSFEIENNTKSNNFIIKENYDFLED